MKPRSASHLSEVDRRRFLALALASAAVGSSGCADLDNRGEIVSYTRQPEAAPAGVPSFLASTMIHYPHAPAVLVTRREGRPVKVEGNPEHRVALGSLSACGQAAIWDLYNPDRLKRPRQGKREIRWAEFDDSVRQALQKASSAGKSILLITPGLSSPTARALVERFKAAYPSTTLVALETFHYGEAVGGRRRVLGETTLPGVRWDRADVILGLDCDFLGPHGYPADQRGFCERRRPDAGGKMNRLWVVEGGTTATGCSADHRLSLRPSRLGRLLVWLLGQTVQRGLGPLAKDQAVRSALLSAAGAAPSFLGLDGAELAILAKELISGAGRGVVLAGAHLPAWIHALTAALNVSLGNEGSVLDSGLGINPPWCSSEREIRTALERAADGGGAVLISLLSNPAYALPQDLRFEDQAARIPLVVASCLTPDETAAIAGWVAPCAHDLESWGDSDWHVGTLTLRQPAIQPLFGARQWEESLLQWMPSPIRPAADYRAFLRDRWRTEVYPQTRSAADFNQFWAAALHDGLVETTPQAAGSSTVSSEAVLEAIAEAQVEERAGFDVVLTPGARMFDGRFADNGWLQELPHPVTSQVWGNGAVMSRDAAARLRCREGDLVRLSVAERTVTLPVVIEPGVCDEVISVELGYGRRASGAVGVAVGVDAGLLRSAAGGFSPWLYGGVEAASAGGAARVVRVQEHHNVEGRRIVVEGTLSVYRSRPDFVNLGNQSRSADYLHKWRYTGHKWGMAVDLNACIGCGACVTACMAENNTPVVGPDQVARGREMHWIRIDRYYRGPLDQPRTVFQPMLCQHCDYAPCEKVCPVAATVHSPEGLSEMVYNRCVGTRYCANNCPYKVRRFNFFNYHEGEASPRDLMYNPEVTLRSRGVMEKCTFCVQRIAAARQSARVERRALQDGELLTACQQACPTGAIVFGDLNNAESRVHRLTERRRGYRVIEEVGTRPAVTYLAKIRNPNPDVKA